MLRDANKKDLSAIVKMAREFWKDTYFKEEEFQPEMVEGMAEKSMKDDLCLVYEIEGVVQGFICGIKGCLLANSDVLIGTELAWWVNPDYRDSGAGLRLLSGIEKKAKNLGIKYWNMLYMESSMPEQIKCIYQNRGYKMTENLYTKVL